DYYNVTSLCKQAVANNPTEAKYYILMAKAYAMHPRFLKDAETSYQKAIELNAWNPDYHVELAEFYHAQGLSLRAKNACKKALAITPTHPGAQELLQKLKGK
ncbi:MAG TPA: tetratricopeptide repeat protein, partial [Acidobacteriota bacterium]|nr:tetratricopeptide repeat protein [Acidobacteriota bacterium]